MKNNKILPVGVDSFEKIREGDFYYIDKTIFIKTLIETAGEVNLFTRPRRFGKTLLMSTLKCFFEIGANPELFSGLAIEQEKKLCEEYQGKYPVVSIALKSVEGNSYQGALNNLKMILSVAFQKYGFILNSDKVSEVDKDRFRNILGCKADEAELKYALSIIIRMLHAHYGKKVILLIDEYDVPLDKSYQSGYYENMVSFMRTFFGEAFKTNPDLQFAVVTGCLRISKESIFTGINNLKIDSISDKHFDEYFGFTDSDVKKLLADFDLNDAYDDMRNWYDGYHFGDTDVYCPWDVINHCDKLLTNPKAKPQAYWINTSSNYIVKMFIDKADATTRDCIERLISGEAIERPIVENLTYSELDETIDNLWSVLYLTGYLTRDREREAARDEDMRLVIPNREVRAIFVEKIQKWFGEKVRNAANKMNEMYRALACGEVEKAEKIISSQLRGTISYYDYNEGFYHGFLIGMLSGNPDWIIRSNRENGLGRSDITLEDAEGEFGVVIEVKRAENAKALEEKCDTAIAQIVEKGYGEQLIEDVETVWAYGIAFSDKKCRMKAKRLK